MALIRSRDTKPELRVRRIIHAMGYRYRLHKSDLPGKPDLTFISRKKVVFVHGCFWHGHKCSLGRIPKTRIEFWTRKIEKNKENDKKNLLHLKDLGWESLVLWECQLKDEIKIKNKIFEFLG